ncbi:MAG TPA: HTTM domain-containing protein [Thermodesulfobacteriota bacterium]|nr:HTTM domain-containing protein [Thermodesulfobacteriota bacterium]
MNKFLGRFQRAFYVDLRSLALTRIAFSLLILVDLFIRALALEAHYTDFGLMPRNALLDLHWNQWHVSLHMISGLFAVQFFFTLAASFAFLLLVGYQTTMSTIVSWLLLVSLHNRNPLVLQGEDFIFRCLLFWGIFMPWGARFSVDAYLKPGEKKYPDRLFSPGALAFMAQIVMMYVFSALLKTGFEWRRDFTAIYYALSSEQYRHWLGALLYEFPNLMKAMTFTVYWLETLGSILFFIPFKNGLFRVLGILAFGSFQFGLFLTMRLGLFPWVSMAALLIFLPSKFWEIFPILSSTLGRCAEKLAHFIRTNLPLAVLFVGRQDYLLGSRSFAQAAVVIPLLVYVFFWNLSTIQHPPVSINRNLLWIGHFLRLDQKWDMFAPRPFTDDGWYVIPGTLRNGNIVDVFRDGAKISWEKPGDQHADYKTYRWHKYMWNLWLIVNSKDRLYYGKYLCRKWNREHQGQEQLITFDIYYLKEETLPNYKTKDIEKIHLWNHHCF